MFYVIHNVIVIMYDVIMMTLTIITNDLDFTFIIYSTLNLLTYVIHVIYLCLYHVCSTIMNHMCYCTEQVQHLTNMSF